MTRRRLERPDAGAVTAELAIGLVAVAAVLVAVLAVGAATVARVRCTDAARAGARAAAIGQDDAAVRAVAVRVAGGLATASVERQDDGWVQVTVEVPVIGGGPARGLRATSSATAWTEP